MFRALVRAYGRFRDDEIFLPSAHKWRVPTWVVELESDGSYFIKGPFSRGDHADLPAPDRQRSGSITAKNLKPKLLFDDPRYTFGLNFANEDEQAISLMHRGYMSLLSDAADQTQHPLLIRLIDFLDSSGLSILRQAFSTERKKALEAIAINKSKKSRKPKESVFQELWTKAKSESITFRVNGVYLVRIPQIQSYWLNHLRSDLVFGMGQCSICGSEKELVRLVPGEITIQGQNCQITSFNKTAFDSYGKTQTKNANLCFDCAVRAVDTLRYLLDKRSGHSFIVIGSKDTSSNLNKSTAVYWTSDDIDKAPKSQNEQEGINASLEELLASFAVKPSTVSPTATLETIERTLQAPLAGSSILAQSEFHIALIAANNRRFVLRDHISQPVGEVVSNIRSWLKSAEVVDYFGERRVPSLAEIARALSYRPGSSNIDTNHKILQNLFQIAYTGAMPSAGLLAIALLRFKNPKLFAMADSRSSKDARARFNARATIWSLASAMKVWFYYMRGEEEMEELSKNRNAVPYLLGRLLAWIERVQWEASGRKLERTVAQTHFGLASTAPALAFGQLLKAATVAYLPKLTKSKDSKQAGFGVNAGNEIARIMSRIVDIPKTLTLEEQAEFALGFYHQRADFRSGYGKKDQEESDE